MHSGLRELVCGVHFEELVASGLREQAVNRALSPARMTRKQHLAALLGSIRARLHDEQTGPETGGMPAVDRDRSASGSAPEPVPWLSPYRMP